MPLILVRAKESDWPRLLSWRNDPETLRQSWSDKAVTVPEHLEWLATHLSDDSSALFIVRDTDRGAHVETARVDIQHDKKKRYEFDLSLTVDPQHRGRGYAA